MSSDDSTGISTSNNWDFIVWGIAVAELGLVGYEYGMLQKQGWPSDDLRQSMRLVLAAATFTLVAGWLACCALPCCLVGGTSCLAVGLPATVLLLAIVQIVLWSAATALFRQSWRPEIVCSPDVNCQIFTAIEALGWTAVGLHAFSFVVSILMLAGLACWASRKETSMA